MALVLRVSPEIWKLTLLSSLTGLSAVQLVGCALPEADSTRSNNASNASGVGASGSTHSGQGGTASTGGNATNNVTNVAGVGGAGTAGRAGEGGTGGATETACDEAMNIPLQFRCQNSRPMDMPGDASTSINAGFEVCGNGIVHRATQVDCVSELPRALSGTELVPLPADAGEYIQCQTDADCTEAPHGFCTASPGQTLPANFPGGVEGYQPPNSYCAYGCVTDSDCGADAICECSSPVGHCVEATCTTDGDCACDATCMRLQSEDPCGAGARYRCQQPTDACVSDNGCGTAEYCTTTSMSSTLCQPVTCAVGRPFLVQGQDRRAEVISRADWANSVRSPQVQPLSTEQRNGLAFYWQEVGAMEHASIAAFARFVLELMGQGAPPRLIAAAQRAMLDETQHAQLAFGLASAYAAGPLGPGPLSLEGAQPNSSLKELVTTTILEGAVGETCAALEAVEALAHAQDPVVKSVLSKIVNDEMQHARLAWDFLSWAFEQQPELKAHAANVFASLEQASVDSDTAFGANAAVLAQHGLLSSDVRREIRNQALCHVVLPAAATLLGLDLPLQSAA